MITSNTTNDNEIFQLLTSFIFLESVIRERKAVIICLPVA